jgi:hypothetical protein
VKLWHHTPSYLPPLAGLAPFLCLPTAYAVGCIIMPLRGQEMNSRPLAFFLALVFDELHSYAVFAVTALGAAVPRFGPVCYTNAAAGPN